jgi:tetratricopeptide (TPR) repeat protein
MALINPAYELFRSYRFKEAVEAYRRQLREGPDTEWANLAGLAHSLLATGEFSEAIPYLEKITVHDREPLPGSPGCDEELSVCYWMIGERLQALGIVRDLVVGVRDGKIHYTDFAGGVSQGLILCYMAATLRAWPDVDLAMNYLKKLSTRPRIKNWPGPAALFLLGGLTFGEVVKDATGSADLAQAKKVAEKDLLERRWLTNILFAAGTERRMAGDEAGSRLFFTECASLTNPLVEYEWYLAKSEATASSQACSRRHDP